MMNDYNCLVLYLYQDGRFEFKPPESDCIQTLQSPVGEYVVLAYNNTVLCFAYGYYLFYQVAGNDTLHSLDYGAMIDGTADSYADIPMKFDNFWTFWKVTILPPKRVLRLQKSQLLRMYPN